MSRNVLWEGLVAGTAGVVVMTLAEKIEQRFTGRPNSYVPAQTLARLTRMPEQPTRHPLVLNWVMHYGQGALLGILRAVMSEVGLRGPLASAKFTVLRLTNDQILENATGVGAPPQTWPRKELAIDVLHKAVYGFTTGAITDALAARRGLGPGQQHAARAPGRQSDVGPLPVTPATQSS
ncbi:hypothetical protein [Mycolicibacterium mengxianglii]|uniref:hypothetical protein n=1 Tax=Mycolicibacterium mengxianglii TaxID=2736649 RepID=UPI0018EEF6B1|nr:hypothetical protein [Mycolicibacterium mengxianglii]